MLAPPGTLMKLANTNDRIYFMQSHLIKDMDTLNKILEGKPVSFFNVRHPFERLVSAYTMFRKQNRMDVGRETFVEFIQEEVLLKANSSKTPKTLREMEPHLRPSNTYCAFCNIKYDIVSYMNTFREDTERIREILGLEKEEKEQRLRINTGDKIQNVTTDYFKNISETDKTALIELYKYDFAMFDFDPYFY